MRSAVASETSLTRVSELIAKTTGLHFPIERQSDLWRRLTDLARELDCTDTAACIDWLLASSLTTAQLQALANHLTIGETYFFRDRRTFEVLADSVLPELIRSRRNSGQYLRLWSAACCTGEEPYSLAILLHRLIPDIDDWRITILATDINQKFLRKACDGIYGDWSFRQSPTWLRDLYFRSAGKGRYEIAPQIRKLVTFRPANLVDDDPAGTAGSGAMDVILCRNVLMYFTPRQAAKAVDSLHATLTDGGWMVTSPCEASQTLFARFTPSNFPGAILYRKNSKKLTTSQEATHAWGNEPVVSNVPEPVAAAPSKTRPPGIDRAPGQATPDRGAEAPPRIRCLAQSLSSTARALADQGDLDGALLCCDKWVDSDKLNPAAHYLRAAILQENGDYRGARISFMRTIYLQPDWPLAHFALGNAARALGDEAESSKHFANAARLLMRYEPEHVFAESDGLTAARLNQIICSLMTSRGRL